MDMAYRNRFAACVLVNGQIMKELPDGSIGLPFGSEYTLRLFNKHDRRAVAKISIDQENVSEGGFVVPAHGKIDIERRADRDTSFRFVELGSDAALLEGKPSHDPLGEMGVIQVDFHLEKPYTPPSVAYPLPAKPRTWPKPYQPYQPYQPFWYSHTIGGGGPYTSDGTYDAQSPIGESPNIMRGRLVDGEELTGGAKLNASVGQANCYHTSPIPDTADASPINETTLGNTLQEGCTVEGHETGQGFSTVWIDYEDTCTSITMYLQGYKRPVKIRQPRKRKARRAR